mmetsp:Transcript_59543/g.128840  ORF Transcript_59543/g.128840 Transcript_59543/m.128840 type:complete len:201 (+) Transcript_59543:409-1011(+)
MLPMELSAVISLLAAVIDAKVSGKLVPKATNVIAVMPSGMPMVQPSRLAMSLVMAVTMPTIARAEKNVAQPLQRSVGGTSTKIPFQKSERMCSNQSILLAAFCSSGPPLQKKVWIAFSRHLSSRLLDMRLRLAATDLHEAVASVTIITWQASSMLLCPPPMDLVGPIEDDRSVGDVYLKRTPGDGSDKTTRKVRSSSASG